MIPDRMKEVGAEPSPCSADYHGKKGFVGKTIDGIFSFLQEAFVSETYAKRDGLLQKLDPRAKLISILAVIFASSVIGDLRLLILEDFEKPFKMTKFVHTLFKGYLRQVIYWEVIRNPLWSIWEHCCSPILAR